MIQVPAPFAAGTRAREGEAGLAWIADLPQLVAHLCHRWHLRLDGPPMHGHLALVVPVRRGAEPCALKISWQDTAATHEAQALAIWDGRGAVRLLDAEPAAGAMLLERLDPRRTLHAIPIDQAIRIAGDLVRLLSIPGDPTLPTVSAWAERVAHSLCDRWERQGRPLPKRLVDQAADHATHLPASPDRRMVNWDLHYGNVLAGTRSPWLAIDPKPAVGPPEFGIAQLLWTRLDAMTGPADLRRHIQTLTETAGLDPPLTRAWTLVRVVDYWLWALSIGLTEDPKRCATVIEWMGD